MYICTVAYLRTYCKNSLAGPAPPPRRARCQRCARVAREAGTSRVCNPAGVQAGWRAADL
jgi:hypothetical protein